MLYVTGEESAAQVRLRADRIGAVGPSLYLAAETELAALLAHVEAVQPQLLIVDSVQTITAPGVDGTPGGVTQIREVTSALMAVAKQQSLTTVLVGHVTKDGAIAGPRALEHLVDVVLHFEGDRHAAAPDGAGAEEPVRPDRRGGLLRARRVRPDRPARSERAVRVAARQAGARNVRDGHAGGPPPAARGGADPGGGLRAGDRRAGSPPAWTPPGWGW